MKRKLLRVIITINTMVTLLMLTACSGNATPNAVNNANAPESVATPAASQSDDIAPNSTPDNIPTILAVLEWSDIEYTEYTQQIPTPPFTVALISFREHLKMLNVFFADSTYDTMKEYSKVLIANGFEERNAWEDDGEIFWVEYSNADGWVVSVNSDTGSTYTDSNGGSIAYCGYINIHDETDR